MLRTLMSSVCFPPLCNSLYHQQFNNPLPCTCHFTISGGRKVKFATTITTTTSTNAVHPRNMSFQDKGSARPLRNYSPGFWDDRFLNYTPDDETTQAMMKEVDILKEEVKEELLSVCNDPLKCLQYVNALELLGVAYHFNDEIGQGLQHIYQSYHGNDEDLYHTSLRFRILRQHGYYMSCGVFNKFKDEKGNFKEFVATDVHGMLALYEASYLRVRGEDILDEALAFTTTHLKSMAAQLSYPLSAQVAHALQLPMQKYFSRVDQRHHISMYESDPSRNKRLKMFAKLDFNLLQSLHMKELKDLAGWWQGFDFRAKLPLIARDRMVEYFYFYTATHYEPQYARLRAALTKLSAIWTFADDLHDLCNCTIEELEPLNEALERWDKNMISQLPDPLDEIYAALFNVMEEIKQDSAKEGRSCCFHYAIEELKALSCANLQDAKWRLNKQVPTYEEFLSNGVVTFAYVFLYTVAFIYLGEIATEEVFKWVTRGPKAVYAALAISKLTNDISECGVERDGEVSSITCYMKEFDAPKEQAIEELCKQVADHWKDFNQETLQPTAMPRPILTCILNLLRGLEMNHVDRDDLFTLVTPRLKEDITKLFIEPISI